MAEQWKMLALLLCTFTVVSGEFMFTLPRVMEAASNTSFCLILNDLDLEDLELQEDFTVTVNLEFWPITQHDYMIEKYKYEFSAINIDGDFNKCQEVQTPYIGGEFFVVVNASVAYSADGSLEEVEFFVAGKVITVTRPDLITLVQTDKPIYKPGQTVKFRVMTMDYKLMSRTDGYQQITIETPSGSRVMQWDDVPSPTGLVSLEMPLSSDPVLGSWIIKVLYGSKEIKQTFKVDEYVLPKFDVTVTPPKYLLPTTQDIHGTVCAKYTYGKPVKGDLKMKVCYKAIFSFDTREQRPCAYIKEKIDGCHEFFISAERIKLGYREYGFWGMLSIEANVTEEQTGIELSGSSEGLRLSFSPLNLRIEDDTNFCYKPGFPYNGRVVVSNPDGSPAPGEVILVEAISYVSNDKWAYNFTSNENGIVHFTITEISASIGSLNLQAEAVVYQRDWRYTTDELFYRTYTPRAYRRLTKWFSPSDSYLYIPDVDTVAKCNSELNLDVYYTAENGVDYKFTTLVKAGNKIMSTEEKSIRADDSIYNIDILSVDKSLILQKQPKIPSSNTTANLVGYFKLSVPVSQDMSPNAKVLVFYMREVDKEVVASTIEFKVKNCFKNKVSMSFDEVKVRPGTNVNLNIGASPSSNCFVGMVDKSVTLLGGNNQLTPSQLFEKVNKVSRPYHYISYWQEERAYCGKKSPPKGPEGPERYYYSSSYPEGVDAEQAFRNVDLWVETDALLQSRPCTERRQLHYVRGGTRLEGPGVVDDQLPVPKSLESSVVLDLKTLIEDKEKLDVLETIRTYFSETWLWDIIKIGFVKVSTMRMLNKNSGKQLSKMCPQAMACIYL